MFSFASLVFAQGDAGVFWLFVFIFWIGYAAVRWNKWQEEQQLRKQDPATYLELQRLQHEKEKMEHEKKQSALKIGGAIGTMLLNRFLK